MQVGLYRHNQTGYWHLDIDSRDSPTGRRYRPSTNTQDHREAERIRIDVEDRGLEALRGPRPSRGREYFLRDYWEYVRAHFAPTTYSHYQYQIPPVLDACDWPPTARQLRRYWQRRIDREEVQPISVNSSRRAVNACLTWGVQHGYLKVNPCSEVPPWPVANPASVEWYDDWEVSAILVELAEEYHPVVRWSLLTGMRLNESLGLRWGDIGERIRIVGKGRKVRHLPVTDGMADALGAARHGERPFPFKPGSVSQAFRRARRRAGIEKGSFHALRDTFARNFILAGGDIYRLSKVLGHSSVRVTERYYAHIIPDDLAEDLERLSRKWHGPPKRSA